MRSNLLLLTLWLAPPAFAQFSLYQVTGNVELPPPATLDFGAVYPAESVAVPFRIRNTSQGPAALNLLEVKGTGFAVSGAPDLPASLDPFQAIDFTVVFQSGGPGTYSASLDTEGASVLLTATVLPRLTYMVVTGDGAQTIGEAPIDFGAATVGNSVQLHFQVTNLTGLLLAAPGIAVEGSAFRMAGGSPAGTVFQPGDTAGFTLEFQPAAAGAASGTLIIGDRRYSLAGTGLPVPTPAPLVAIVLPQPQSNQQGTVAVPFDGATQTDGIGLLTLRFDPLTKGATDPAIQLGVVGNSVPLSFARGDTEASLGGVRAVNFQTGTTAGTLTFTATIAGVSAEQRIDIAAAPVGVISAAGERGAGSLRLSVGAFDNTRTAGLVTYLFYDNTGKLAAPAMTVDSSSGFAAYFASSGSGGNFMLQAVFPVNGNASGIAAFEVRIANAAGTATTGRVNF